MVAIVMALAPAAAHAASVRVADHFHGVTFQRLKDLGPQAREAQLETLAGLGIDEVRMNASWAAIEPTPPIAGVHSYRWGWIDEQIEALARNGMRAQPTITQTPYWNAPQGLWITLQCAKARSRAPVAIAPYVDLARAFTRRYGRGGSFWDAHPTLPSRPVIRYEIWNEPNLKGGWCPRPQPEVYAEMFVDAANAIRAVDPFAEVVTGGIAATNPSGTGGNIAITDFFARAIGQEPQLPAIASAAAVHVYPPTDPLGQLGRLADFRDQLRAGGIPNSLPMLVNEIGWATRGGAETVSELDRAAALREVAENFARTNCNVAGVMAHTWISPEYSATNPEDWFGIADPDTAEPYPSAIAYSQGVRLMRGELAAEPPTATLMACPGMPRPDTDGDGVLDEADYYPLDPTRA